jgi:hypothetical protein
METYHNVKVRLDRALGDGKFVERMGDNLGGSEGK